MIFLSSSQVVGNSNHNIFFYNLHDKNKKNTLYGTPKEYLRKKSSFKNTITIDGCNTQEHVKVILQNFQYTTTPKALKKNEYTQGVYNILKGAFSIC